MTIVSDPAQITASWFTNELGGGEATVTDVTLDWIDTGATCRMVRATLSWDADGAGRPLRVGGAPPTRALPGSVIVKFPTADASTLALARAMRMYELEVRFYRDLLPTLGAVSVPACHLAELDDAAGGFTLVLDDLTHRARAGDVLTESSREDCAAVLCELAALQAASWNADASRNMAWLSDPKRTIAVFDSMPAGLEPFLARFGDKLKTEQIALFERVIPQAGRWIRSWDGPSVVQHGDLRTDNILFGTDASVPPATIIDFQTVRLGPPGVDPSYFIGSSVSTNTRREIERDLLAEFHQRLCGGGVTDFDFDACLTSYREGALYAVYLFCGLSAQVAPSERVDRVIADQTRRYADMALDLDSARLAGLR